MKVFCMLSALTLVGTCATPKYTTKIQNIKESILLVDKPEVTKYASTITSDELKTHLYTFASKAFKGRAVGEPGQKKAAQFLKRYYQDQQITSPLGDTVNYFQNIPKTFFNKDLKDTENVMAFIKGEMYPEDIIIISAHLDHLGFNNKGETFYGADDNASGTAALMEMAQAFKLAKEKGHGPKRSILFLHLTAEEIGKKGSEYYTQHPIFPLKNTITNLNIDMIGRVDDTHKNNPNYLYLIGSDRISKELHYISEKVNNAYFHMDLDYRYNAEGDRNQYYTRSDHYNFAAHGIPVIFYFNGEHSDYHQPTDTPDKIQFDLLEQRARFIFATAWQIANQNHRLLTDENNNLLK